MLTHSKIEAEIERANREDRTLWLTDGGKERGPKLLLQIKPGGAKRARWHFRYSHNGRRVEWPLGKSFADLGLQAARKEFARLVVQMETYGCLREQQQAELEERLQAQRAAEAAQQADEVRKKYTLRKLLEEYVAFLDRGGKSRSSKSAESVFRHLTDVALGCPAREVTAAQLTVDIRRVLETGKRRTAGLLRSYLHAAYRLAAQAEHDPSAPSSMIPFHVTSNPVASIPAVPVAAGQRTLSEKELRTYFGALGNSIIDSALKLALLSGGQRIAQMVRLSVEDFNKEAGELRLLDPKGRRVTPRLHVVPLGPQGRALAEKLVERAAVLDSPWLFSHRGTTPMHQCTPGQRLTEIAREMGGQPFDVRDVRRTVETELARLGVSRDVRAQLLSHGLSGVQQAHYDRHDYLAEKLAALLRWEGFLAGEKPGKVLPIRAGVAK